VHATPKRTFESVSLSFSLFWRCLATGSVPLLSVRASNGAGPVPAAKERGRKANCTRRDVALLPVLLSPSCTPVRLCSFCCCSSLLSVRLPALTGKKKTQRKDEKQTRHAEEGGARRAPPGTAIHTRDRGKEGAATGSGGGAWIGRVQPLDHPSASGVCSSWNRGQKMDRPPRNRVGLSCSPADHRCCHYYHRLLCCSLFPPCPVLAVNSRGFCCLYTLRTHSRSSLCSISNLPSRGSSSCLSSFLLPGAHR
jgi:hypothetical protein